MKEIRNEVVPTGDSVLLSTLDEGESSEVRAAELARLCLKVAPPSGLKIGEMRKRQHVLDVIEPKLRTAKSFKLEEGHVKTLKGAVESFDWPFYQQSLVDFLDAVDKLKVTLNNDALNLEGFRLQKTKSAVMKRSDFLRIMVDAQREDQRGFKAAEVRRRVRIIDALEAEKSSKDDVIRFEDEDYDALIELADLARWSLVDRGLIELYDYLKAQQ